MQSIESSRILELRPVTAALHQHEVCIGDEVCDPLTDLVPCGGIMGRPDHQSLGGDRRPFCFAQVIALPDLRILQYENCLLYTSDAADE